MKVRISLAMLLLACFGFAAQAESIVTIGKYWAFETDVTFTMLYQGIGKSRSVNYTYSQQLFPGFPGPSVSGTIQAGELFYAVNGATETVWSMDIAQPVSQTTQTYNAALLLDTNFMLSLDKLYYQYGQFVVTHQASVVALTDAAAGFQLAIWELTYETMGFNLLTGSFSVNASASATIANDWLANLDSMTAPGSQRKILVNSTTQDVVHYQPVDIIIPSVPEPLTMLSISIAGAAVGGYVLRRFKSKAA